MHLDKWLIIWDGGNTWVDTASVHIKLPDLVVLETIYSCLIVEEQGSKQFNVFHGIHSLLPFFVVVDLQTCQFLRTTQATLSCLQTQISCLSPQTMMTLVISITSSMFQFSKLFTIILWYCVLLCLQLSISLMPSTGHLNQTRRNHRQRYSNCY